MKRIIRLLWILIILLTTQFAFSQKKPNILIIHVDDLGYHDLSLTGSRLYDTPHIDRLAGESVVFTNAYASYPRCTPSRYGMMTATYPVNENKGHLGAIPESKNFIRQFDKAGYNTYYVGKWHLGKGDNAPNNFGYTDSYAALESGGLGSRFYPFNMQKNGKPAKYRVPDLEEDGKSGDYASDLLTDATIRFIKNNPKGKPFLAVIAFYAVHTPLEAKKKDIERNREQLKHIDFANTPEYIREGEGRRKMRQDNPAYAGMVENVDENVSRLLQTLEELGISGNTIIVFSSDHGGLSNDGYKGERELATTNLPLRAGKGWLYEGGIRVPLFVKWPGHTKPREDHESIILGMDVFPTLLDMALNKSISGLDGKSYKKVLLNKENWNDRTVFWNERKARPHSTGENNASVVRSGDYKLIDFYESGRTELYNLKKDEGESHNLSKEMPEKTVEMMKLLNDWKVAYLIPEKMEKLKKKDKKKKGRKKDKS